MLTCSSTLAPSFFSSSISNFISSTSYRISAVSWVCFNQCIADQLKGATKVTCCFAFIFFVDSSAFFLLFFTSSSAVLSSFSRWDFASWNQVKCGFQHELTIISFRYSLSWQFTFSTQMIKPVYLLIPPPTQHHSFYLFYNKESVKFPKNYIQFSKQTLFPKRTTVSSTCSILS